MGAVFARLMAGDSRPGEYEYVEGPVLTGRGEERLIAWNSTVLRSDQGEIVGTLSSGEDITERRSLEEQFHQAQKMEGLGRLAGGVAHDFNNVLTIVNGYAELLGMRLAGDESLKGYVEEVVAAGKRAAGITAQLLAFSRKQTIQPRRLDVSEVVENATKMLRRLIGEDLELTTSLAPDLGPILADEGQVNQVLMNLAVNARDAMPRGGTLHIETANVTLDDAYARRHVDVHPGAYVLMAISDTGCGMDKETQARIFEPFFTTKGVGEGTGLGLSTVYGIVKQNGGQINVYSEVGHGTTFKIYLPRVAETEETLHRQEEEAELPGGTETVLLVEDEDDVRRIVSHMLALRGYRVMEAGAGPGAVAQARQYQEPIHLLLTDVIMPGMSGRDLAERLASSHPETRVLYMSGYPGNVLVTRDVVDAGFAFIQKPLTSSVLLHKVREVLDGSESRGKAQ